jgi:hypothetical protein
MDQDKVIYYLDIWRDYMKPDNHKLGYKSKSTGFISGGVHSVEDWEEESDSQIGPIVYTCIEDLPIMQKNAIYIVYLNHKATMDTRVLEYYYDSALMMLQRKLKEKNLY